jgi:hypothetical protein
MKATKPQDDARVDCVDFFRQAEPYLLEEVADFLGDHNAPVEFNGGPGCLLETVASRFLPPDLALIYKERLMLLGSATWRADDEDDPALNIELARRRLARRTAIEAAALAAIKTDKAPWSLCLSPTEQAEFHAMVRALREDAERRKQYKKGLLEQEVSAGLAWEMKRQEAFAEADRRIVQSRINSELEARMAAEMAEQELLMLEARQPVVMGYIRAMVGVHLRCARCNHTGIVSFARHGRVFWWPCECIGGRDPECVRNWEQRTVAPLQ